MPNPQEQQMQMLRQIQQMQHDMQAAQEDLANTRVEATVGGGVVKATVTGERRARRDLDRSECRRSGRRRDARGSRASRRSPRRTARRSELQQQKLGAATSGLDSSALGLGGLGGLLG